MAVSSNVTALHQAIKNRTKNDILEVLAVAHKAALRTMGHDGNTVLHLLFTNKHLKEVDIIELLEAFLDRGANLNAENIDQKSVLHLAVEGRMRKVVVFLTKRKVEIGKGDQKGNTIAHHFVKSESRKFHELLKSQVPDTVKEESEGINFAELLVKQGFDFDLENKEGVSALQLAINYNLQHILHVLVKYTQEVFIVDCEKKLLHDFFESKRKFRKKYGDLESSKLWYCEYESRYAAAIVKILLDRGFSSWLQDGRNRTCLWAAIECGENMSVIEVLVDHRLKSINASLATSMFAELLTCSSLWGDSKIEYFLKVLRNLIDSGADVNANDGDGMTPAFYAVRYKKQRAIDFLIECGANFSIRRRNGDNMFHPLARTDDFDEPTSDECLEALFELIACKCCCDMNARNGGGETSLHVAVQCGNLAIARKLIDCGVEINCKNDNGWTPLHYAVGDSEGGKLAELLLESGADVNGKDNWGRRPLALAVRSSDTSKLVPQLLKRGAYVNLNADDYEQSPLFSAIRCQQFPTARELLKHGADINNDVVVPRLLNCFKGTFADETSEAERFLVEHWIKLKAAKLPCSKVYERLVKSNSSEELRQECLKEIETLKATFIDSRTSIYNFLHMGFGSRRIHINNEKLQKLVQSPKLDEQFPNYSIVILASYHDTVIRKSLLKSAKRAWMQLTEIALPDECLELIFAHLSNIYYFASYLKVQVSKTKCFEFSGNINM